MKEVESVLHIMIIWSKAERFKNQIITELDKEFEIIKTFKIHWEKKYFKKNLSIFYSHSLKDIPLKNARKILTSKQKRVGSDDFYAIVFEDKSPIFQQRKTTSGNRIVNIHVFDKKVAFRKLSGGGSRIHCSDDSWETNKDLTILFGLNANDFLNKFKIHSKEPELFQANCLGTLGYESIEQFFYVLNNTIKYCVLRNHECIPNEYTVEGHGDIDLLVEHKDYAIRLTGAKRVFPQYYRVYHLINIGGKEVPFDFRFVGDNYYDEKWEYDILETRTLRKNLFYTPNALNQYYSLLYHAFIQKPIVKDDYIPKLSSYAFENNLKFEPKIIPSVSQLSDFMYSLNYQFVYPQDKSVYVNKKNIRFYQVWKSLNDTSGIINLSQLYENNSSLSNFIYFKGDLDGRKVFVKYGGVGDSCINEFNQARKAYEFNSKHFVEPIALKKDQNSYYIIFEWAESLPVDDYLRQADSHKKDNVKKQMIEIFETLQKVNIMHRDIRPDNFFIVDDTLKLIDFQYAIDNNKLKELDYVKKDKILATHIGNYRFRHKLNAWKDSSSILKTMQYWGIDNSDIHLSEDTSLLSMPLYKYYYYRNLETVFKAKRKIKRQLKMIKKKYYRYPYIGN